MKVAKLDRSKFNKEQSVYMPQIPNIAECPDHLLPLKQWEDAFLADFTELRLVFFFPLTSSTLSARLIVLFSFLLCMELIIRMTTFCFKLMPVSLYFLILCDNYHCKTLLGLIRSYSPVVGGNFIKLVKPPEF